MKSIFVVYAVFFTFLTQAQNYSSCEIYQCGSCNMQVLSGKREGICPMREHLGGYQKGHQWQATGRFDAECNRQEQASQNKLNEIEKSCQAKCPKLYQGMKVLECYCPETIPAVTESNDGKIHKEYFRSGKPYLEDNRTSKTVVIYEENGGFRKGAYTGDKWILGNETGEWINTKAEIRGYEMKLIITEYAKGWRVVIRDGEIIEAYDNKNTDLLAKRKQEINEKEKQTQKENDLYQLTQILKSDKASLEDLKAYNLLDGDKYDVQPILNLKKLLIEQGKDDTIGISFEAIEKKVIENILREKFPCLNQVKNVLESSNSIVVVRNNNTIFSIQGIKVLNNDSEYDYVIEYLNLGEGKLSRRTKYQAELLTPNHISTINTKNTFENYNSLLEEEQYMVSLTYTSLLFRQYCFDSYALHNILNNRLTPEHQQKLYSFAIQILESENTICETKATQELESVRLTYIAYLYWAKGDLAKSWGYFEKCNSLKADYNRYISLDGKWIPCSYKDYLTKYYHQYYFEGSNQYSKVSFPSEKDMLKKIKTLY